MPDNSLWQDIEAQLEKFIQHLKEDHVEDVYSLHCNYYAWADWRPPHGSPVEVPSPGDIIICTLMTNALYFLNGWSKAPGTHTADHSGGHTALKDFIRCGIVNMFMHLLEESACNTEWGIFYAWHTMQHMKNDGPFGRNLIYAGTCKNGMEEDIEVDGWSMQQSIKQWLSTHDSIRNRIQHASASTNCSSKIAEYTKKDNGKKNTDDADIVKAQVVQTAKNLSKGMGKIFRQIKKEADDDDEDEHDDDHDEDAEEDAIAKPKSPENGPHGTDDKNKEKEQPSSTPSPTASGAGSPGAPPSPPTGQPRSDGSAGENAVTSATVPIPQAPPAAPPAVEDKGKSSSSASPSSPDETKKPEGKNKNVPCTPVKETVGHASEGGGRVQIQFLSTPSSTECSGTASTDSRDSTVHVAVPVPQDPSE
ncbi:hypothetical protein AK88_05439 [Plasmodium fragile]|uniref:Uncharacterized protein n=1 Tax=Plasmodium fragile TaxID=5857 RepID=A0A0D9QCZ5_PLAFR|nr:uncharacterized protein AK88_05439 [Plasmodium fragile]KJP84930.1 hypothetical protein AK88_05439 [Plasmodium fragile]